jgi:hypothetical protein
MLNALAYNFDTHVPGMISGKLKKSQIHDLIKNLDMLEKGKERLNIHTSSIKTDRFKVD